MTLLATVCLSLNHPLPWILFESDCLILIQDVFDQSAKIGWQVEDWISSINGFFQSHSDHSLNWILRRRNMMAHRLVKWAVSAGVFGYLIGMFVL